MNCVNHMGVAATAYCQNCGKALCPACVRNAPGGMILCEPCLAACQGFQQPFATQSAGPKPWVAAVIGVVPGVGAMYNGQFIKGLIHVVIFAVLVSAAHVYHIFGLFIAAWIVYQSFEAFYTAKALRDGEPPPDPLGLNELGSWLSMGARQQPPRQPGVPPATPEASMPGAAEPAAGGGYAAAPGQGPFAGTYTGAYQASYTPPAGAPGAPYGDPNTPPGPRHFFRRREPVGAVVLIVLGLLFLLGQLDIFTYRMFQFAWPLLLIGLGVWLIVRRMGEGQGGSR